MAPYADDAGWPGTLIIGADAGTKTEGIREIGGAVAAIRGFSDFTAWSIP